MTQMIELVNILQSYGVYESDTELQLRFEILEKLDYMIKKWIKETAIKKKFSESDANKLGGKVLPFGSFRLGVHQKGADIDAVCIAPDFITYRDYFSTFYSILQQRPEVTECRAIEDAFVPVIKLKFHGVEVDLLFARLTLDKIPENIDLRDDKLLQNLDIHSVRSLNGCRVTDEIMNLVPDISKFRFVLRVVKLWAKRRGIYSNTLGFFGGVTWAMLVARICQIYPLIPVKELIGKFFLFLNQWSWPSPVLLKYQTKSNLGFPVWDSRVNKADRNHLMPVITPAYPQQNSTFNVTKSTKKLMLEEFNRAMHISKQIIANNLSWEKLFDQSSFIYKYQQFIALSAESKTKEDHLKWCGLLESKVRILVKTLEKIESIALVHPNSKTFSLKQHKSTWFIGMEFVVRKKLSVDIIDCIQNFTGYVKKDAAIKNVLKDGMTLEAVYLEHKHLDKYLHSSIIRDEKMLMQRDTLFLTKRANERSKYTINYKAERPMSHRKYSYSYERTQHFNKLMMRTKIRIAT